MIPPSVGGHNLRYEISWWQFYLLLITSPLTAVTIFTPMIVTRTPPSRDLWISVIIGSLCSLIIMLLAYVLAKRFEGMTVYEYIPTIFGKYIGFAISLIMISLFVYRSAVILKQYGHFFHASVYLRTPVPVFSVMIVFLGIIAVAEGFEFIGRIAEIAGLSLIVGISFYLIFSAPLIRLEEIRPVLAEGWGPVWEHTWASIVVLGESIIIALLGLPHVNRLKQATKSIFLGWFTTMAFTVATTIVLLGVFGVELLGILALPTLSTARLVSLGNIFERIEWIALVMWLGAMGVRISVFLYGSALGISTLFPKVKMTWSALISGIVAVTVSFFLLKRLTDIYTFFEPTNMLIQKLPLQIAPVLFLIAAWLRGAKTTRIPLDDGEPL